MVIFAVQNGGWCAAANTLGRYRTYGKAGNCKNGKGGAWANNVYRIKKTGEYNLGDFIPVRQKEDFLSPARIFQFLKFL